MCSIPITSVAEIAEHAGVTLFVGPGDRGKTTLVEHIARTLAAKRPVAVLDLDPGQSEIGPPGMMDLAEAISDKPMVSWRARRQWYLGDLSPFTSPASSVAGASRLLAEARDLGHSVILVDTASFVPTPTGRTLATALVDALRPDRVIGVSHEGEMASWLRGLFVPTMRLTPEEAVRVKPQALRAVRRAARLADYFREAPEHTIRLDQWPLRGTRLGLGKPLTATERAAAATAMGCPVVHAERAGATIALWTLGPPRRDTARAAAELGARRAVTYDAAWWASRSAGLLGNDGMCLAMALITEVDWASLTATVRAPVHSTAEAAVFALGQFRHRLDGEGLPAVPDDMI